MKTNKELMHKLQEESTSTTILLGRTIVRKEELEA